MREFDIVFSLVERYTPQYNTLQPHAAAADTAAHRRVVVVVVVRNYIIAKHVPHSHSVSLHSFAARAFGSPALPHIFRVFACAGACAH